MTDRASAWAAPPEAGPKGAHLLRVTVTAGDCRADLAVASQLPVAELLPELARIPGLVDEAARVAGLSLVTSSGRFLRPDAGLRAQGVEDGEVLGVTPLSDALGETPYDDPARAVGEAVSREVPAPPSIAGRRAALVATAGLLASALVAWAARPSTGPAHAPPWPAAGAAALLLGAAVLSRTRARTGGEVVLLLAGLGFVYAAAAGVLATRGDGLARALVGGGAAATVAGAVGLVGLRGARAVGVPAVLAGAVVGGAGGLAGAVPWRADHVLTVVMGIAAVAAEPGPWLALRLTGVLAAATGEGGGDVDRLSPRVRSADHVAAAICLAAGIVTALFAPWAVSTGPPGAAAAVVACSLPLLRSRRCPSRTRFAADLAGGLLGLCGVVLTLVWLHPAWRGWTAAGLMGAAACTLTGVLAPGGSARRRHWGDVLEQAAYVALVPAVAAAAGLGTLVRR